LRRDGARPLVERRPVAAVLDLPQRFAARRTPPQSEQRFRPPESVAAGVMEMERFFSQARRVRASIPAYPNAIVASMHTRWQAGGKSAMPLYMVEKKLDDLVLLDLRGRLILGQETADLRGRLGRLLDSGHLRIILKLE